MLYIDIVNISNIWVPVRFSYFGFRNIGTIMRVLVRFRVFRFRFFCQGLLLMAGEQKNREVFTIPDIQLQLQCNASSSLSACSLS